MIRIKPGDVIECDPGEPYTVLEIGPRNLFEKSAAHFIGEGIIGLCLTSNTKFYILDFDVTKVNGEYYIIEEEDFL